MGVKAVFRRGLHHDAVELGKLVEVGAYMPPIYPCRTSSTSEGDIPLRLQAAASTSTMYCGYFVSKEVVARDISGRC